MFEVRKKNMLYFFTSKNLLNHLNWFIQTTKQDYQNEFGEEPSDPMINATIFGKNSLFYNNNLCFVMIETLLG